ncbi:MAG TPA: choloylglycine hydrolase, partial [Firmicutes bacterium]|nr:choloylglycine hydrolase [Bacillota bacterium]
GITSSDPENAFSSRIDLKKYSRGMGTNFLPGGLSSTSRFVRAAFTKYNSVCDKDEISSVNQFFHILDSVDQQRGCCELSSNKYEITIYSSCCNLDDGIYYYKTYNNHQINAVKLSNIDIEGEKMLSYALLDKENINYQK